MSAEMISPIQAFHVKGLCDVVHGPVQQEAYLIIRPRFRTDHNDRDSLYLGEYFLTGQSGEHQSQKD